MYIMKCDRCGATKELGNSLVYFPLGAQEVPKYNITYMDGDNIKQVTLCEHCERALTSFINDFTQI